MSVFRAFLPVLAFLLLPAAACAETYAGTIGRYPVGMSLMIPTGDGEAGGSYFYQKTGLDIDLKGAKQGPSLTLTERNTKGEKTGEFLCVLEGSGITGKWVSADGKKELNVSLTEISPDRLRAMQQDALLDAFDRSHLPRKDECMSAGLTYTFKNSFIRSFIIHTEYLCGPYPNSERKNVMYNVRTRKPIDFWTEIDPARLEDFKEYLNQETQKRFDEWRGGTSEQEWAEVFSQFGCNQVYLDEENESQSLDGFFTVTDAVAVMTDFHIAEDGVHLGRCHYCGFPHVVQALDFCDEIVIPPAALQDYLKEDSILRNLDAP